MEFGYELGYLHAAVDELEAYLLSDDLFWPINAAPPAGGQPFPRLTLGGLALAQKRAAGLSSNRDEVWQVEQIDRRIDVMHHKWRLRWDEKAQREITSRLTQWKNYLQEYRQGPERQVDFYPYEIRWRVMVELLEGQVESLKEHEVEMRSGLDLMLKAVFIPGEFIWEPSLMAAFPTEPFWYLYGYPRPRK